MDIYIPALLIIVLTFLRQGLNIAQTGFKFASAVSASPGAGITGKLHALGAFPFVVIKHSGESKLRKDGLFWLTVPAYSPVCWRRHGSRDLKAAGRKEVNECGLVFPFLGSSGPQPTKWEQAHSGRGHPTSV